MLHISANVDQNDPKGIRCWVLERAHLPETFCLLNSAPLERAQVEQHTGLVEQCLVWLSHLLFCSPLFALFEQHSFPCLDSFKAWLHPLLKPRIDHLIDRTKRHITFIWHTLKVFVHSTSLGMFDQVFKVMSIGTCINKNHHHLLSFINCLIPQLTIQGL